jgi:pimeloyl-ACP methyl ester carboxylesterase
MRGEINSIKQGQGLPLVFQHGLTANLKQAVTLLQDMNDIQLLSIDCPGHGESRLSPGYQPSFINYADELIRFLDRQGVQKAVFGGISMGSGISVNIALRYPERVSGLVLVRPAWLDRPNPENLLVLLPAAELMGRPDGKQEFSKLPEFLKIEPPAAAQSVLGVFSPDQQADLSRVIRAMVGDRPFEDIEQLKQIDVPTLIIGNDDDPLHPYAMAEKIQQSIPGSVLRQVTSRYIADPLHTTQVRSSIQEFIQENQLHQ